MRRAFWTIGIVLVLLSAGVLLFCGGPGDEGRKEEGIVRWRGRIAAANVKPETSSAVRRLQKATNDAVKVVGTETNLMALASAREELEERDLTEMQREILQELRNVLISRADLKTIRALIERAKALPGVDGDVFKLPVALRRAIVAALSGCGVGALSDMYEFFDDPDPEIVQMTTQAFEQKLMDMSLSDYDRSPILVQISQEIDDQMVLSRLLFMVGLSRPSVGVNTILKIMFEGNEVAKAMAPNLMQTFTFQEGIDTPQAAAEYLKEHPDPEWADQFYGGMKGFSENIITPEKSETADSEGGKRQSEDNQKNTK